MSNKMTAWQKLRLVLGGVFNLIGLFLVTIAIYLIFTLLWPNSTDVGVGHGMTLWVCLVAGFVHSLIGSLLLFSVRPHISKQLFILLLIPLIVSTIILLGIPFV